MPGEVMTVSTNKMKITDVPAGLTVQHSIGSLYFGNENAELPDDWIIPFEQLKFDEEVGRGSFGVVYRGEYLGTRVAIKRLLHHEAESVEELRKEWETEVKIMQTLRHPNILMFMGLSRNDETGELYIITEFLEGGSLEEALAKNGGSFAWIPRIRISLEVARALGLMHEKHYIHRDLKWDNILLDAHQHVKVSDFGLSRIKEEKGKEQQKLSAKGEIWWRAPEVDQGDYDEKVDIFSFGMLIASILITSSSRNQESMSDLAQRIREHIFKNMTRKGGEIIYGVDSSKLRELWPPECPIVLESLAVQCCEYEPSKRPNIKEVVSSLQTLYDRLVLYEKEVRAEVPNTGADLWLSLAVEKIDTTTDLCEISISSQKILEKIDAYLQRTSNTTLDFDHKEFLSQLLSCCEDIADSTPNLSQLSQFLKHSWGTVDLATFSEFWRWFEHCDALIKNTRILPLWRVGFIKGFISGDKCRKLLKRQKIDGTFFVRFSRSSPGNLTITSYQENACSDVIISVEKSGFVPESETKCTLFFTLQDLLKRELDTLKFVFPTKAINTEEFLRAHDWIGEQIKRERRLNRKESGDYSIASANARRNSDLMKRAGSVPINNKV